MSLMKRFALDLDEMATAAAGAARLSTSTERLTALTSVFQECGKRANQYFDPRFAARQLVRECAREFRIERAQAKELTHV
ncbi:hypothetical protein [Streptomyces werraensis]|uniref:hypothetical protein n=1 Tax=Streptomyces werraensis TaxID=68284 RepID=UPI0036F69321